jgi:predicted small secreted protein
MRSKIMAMTLLTVAFVLAGCNTMAGAGKDIEKAGSAISNAAEKK